MSPLTFIHTPDQFTAGNIANRYDEWVQITTDPAVLKTVEGIHIDLLREIEQNRTPYPFQFEPHEVSAIDSQLQTFIRKEIITETIREEGDFISNIFSRPKPDSSVRIILDLTKLNDEVLKLHFKMTSLQTAIDMLRPNAFMGSVDLKDAYYSVKVNEDHQKLLKFIWGNKIFKFKGMPNGLTSAPRTFTKLLTPVFAHLREQGHECFGYIDDSFVIADSFAEASHSCHQLAHTLDSLGFVIHREKSVLKPSQTLVFLGFELNSVTMTVKPTQSKVDKFMRAARDINSQNKPKIREVAGLIGLMISYLPAVQYGGAHVKNLEIDKITALKRNGGRYEARMHISPIARRDIQWWVVNLPQAQREVRAAKPEIVLYTDASLQGWGAHVTRPNQQPTTTGGRWKAGENDFHINVLELKAIKLGLQSLIHDYGTDVQLMTDNTTALAYINKMGGVKSHECNAEAKEIWEWAELRNIWLSASHIPGLFNVEADEASRHFTDDVEWELSPRLWEVIIQKWGLPTIDMFASRINNKVDKYVSWYPEPEAWRVASHSETHFMPLKNINGNIATRSVCLIK